MRVVYEDSQDRLWVGTRNGLNLFDPVSGRFTRFQHHEDDSSSISNDFVYSSLHEDDNGLLWVCTHGGGLNCLDPETGRFTRYRHHAGDPESIADDIVFCLYEDPDGYFWLGTNNGLDRFDPNTGKSRRFGLEAGLPSEVVYSVLPDDQGHIWMSTNNGLCRFSLADHSVLNFDVHDGLQSNEFNGGSYHQGPGGLLYFGGVLGLSVVNPASIQPSPNLARPVITKLFIMGREVSVRPVQSKGENRHILHYDDESGEFYIDRNISFVEHVYLSYRDRFFSLEYAALNSTLQGNTEYSYFMDNLSESWSSTGNRNYVSFAGMRPGTYTFHVRTRNHHGVESPVTASLQITIIPPFWMTTWFHILEILLAAVVAVMVYTYMLKNRTNKLLRKQNEEIARANRQLAESEKRLQELNATKDKFFSIISHDLKNPLSTLLTISDVLVNYRDESGPDHMKQGLQEMHGSLREIHVLLENLLTWSKSQRGKLDFHPVLFNLSNVLQETMNLYRVPASEKDIHLEGAFPEKLQAYGDREMIHTVVRNLVNNAVKFTEKGGRIDLEAALEGNLVIVRVKDSGLGIQASDLERLFRIDEKVKTRGTAGEQGSGLGLILCREFIEKNQGSLHVESQPGKGSIFWFSIPVNGGSS